MKEKKAEWKRREEEKKQREIEDKRIKKELEA